MKLPYHLIVQDQRNTIIILCRKLINKRRTYIYFFFFLSIFFLPIFYSRNNKRNSKLQNFDRKIIYTGKPLNEIHSINIHTGLNENNEGNKKTEFQNKDNNDKVMHDKKDFYNDLNPFSKYELYYVDENDQIPSQDSIEKCSSYSFSGTQLNFVPDVDQNIIEDPFAYVHQPPEKSLIPKNFYQNIKGVHYIEISPGVIVPHNFSAIQTQKVIKFANHSINVTTFDSGDVKEHFTWLPPFDWKIPHGLTKHQLDLFFKQPENHWHFNDCKMWNINVIWEVKNGISKLSEHKKCTNHNYTNNLNFCEWPRTLPDNQKPQLKGDVFAFGGHYIEIFQHFFDNGISHMAAMSFALGLDRIPNISLFSAGCGGTCGAIMNKFGFKNVQGCKNVNTEISAENLILIPSMRVLHPYYFEFFRYNMDKNQLKMTKQEKIDKYKYLFSVDNVTEEEIDQKDKIIILPRGRGSGGNARVIYNIDDVEKSLKKIHGQNNVIVYRKSDSRRINSIDDMRFFFSRAKAIVAPHGGACYNHFFSDKGIDFIEMIPMLDNGKYPKQKYWNKLIPFAHLAFLSSVQLHSQRFWRYITMNVDINYNVDIDDFMNWTKQIHSLAKSGSIGFVDL